MPRELKLRIREEGRYVNAYFMDIKIASIVAAACEADPTVYEDFNALCAKIMKNAIESVIGPDSVQGYEFRNPDDTPE